MKVCHLTSAHPRYDTRIFVKECRSLVRAGHVVTLIVADGLGPTVRDGVSIVDVGAPKGRLDRMLNSTRAVKRAAKIVDADIYHLHDPELLPSGLWLKRRGKRVVFDAHEDVPRQLLDKPYLRPRVARVVSRVYAWFEHRVCARLDAVIAATPHIRERFSSVNRRCVDVNNFPTLEEFSAMPDPDRASRSVAYVGAISETRGVREMLQAMGLTKGTQRLELAGRFAPQELRAELEATAQWGHVRFHGHLDRAAVRALLDRCFAGLVTLRPTASYVEALPVKMFEYMGAGLPVIASDFPLWRDIVEQHACGLCVDPLDPAAIAHALDALTDDPEMAATMGNNGRRAVESFFNWSHEEAKLLSTYKDLEQIKP